MKYFTTTLEILPRLPLITIQKYFARHHLDYGAIIYDQAHNVSFYQRLESVQYNSTLAKLRVLRRTFTVKLYHELGFQVKCNYFKKIFFPFDFD